MIYYDRKTKITQNIKDSKALIFLYKTIPGRILLKLITRKPISKLFSLLTKSRISKIYIKKYIKKNDIDMSKYEDKNYKSFNDFFTRKLKTQSKPKKEENKLISLCDSKLTMYKIDDKLTINVKNSKYSINNLIQEDISNDYKNGTCLVFRLCPEDYHRYHAFDDYEVLKTKRIKGILHTVNPISYDSYKVFTENEREVSLLKTKNFDEVYQIEVGALNIGKIHNNSKKKYRKYEEKGYFSFGGSTIILLFKENVIVIDNDIKENSKLNIETKVSYSEQIAKIINKK